MLCITTSFCLQFQAWHHIGLGNANLKKKIWVKFASASHLHPRYYVVEVFLCKEVQTALSLAVGASLELGWPRGLLLVGHHLPKEAT